MVEDYEIQEMIHRDVYVGDKHVGVVVGERFHPRDEFVKSLRIKVEGEVASEFMRKPAIWHHWQRSWFTASGPMVVSNYQSL